MSLILSDIALQWVLESDSSEQTVLSEIISTYKLPACGQRLLQLQLQPLVREGVLHVTGLLYSVEHSGGKLSSPEKAELTHTQFEQVCDSIFSPGISLPDCI